MLPAADTGRCADPERSVAREAQRTYVLARQGRPGGWIPGREADAIEAKEPVEGTQPEVAVRCLGEGLELRVWEILADRPTGMNVLRQKEVGIESEERVGAKGNKQRKPQPARLTDL